MLQRWKEKLKKMFASETETRETKQRYHVPQSLETKITYQYPRNSRFRFPVIPDEPLENKPAYLRKQQTQKEEEISDLHPQKQIRSDRHIPQTKERFTPSRVASPIYGYRPRKSMSELEQVPAYIRKQSIQTERQDKLTVDDDQTHRVEAFEEPANKGKMDEDARQKEWTNDPSDTEREAEKISNRYEKQDKSAVNKALHSTESEDNNQDVALDIHTTRKQDDHKQQTRRRSDRRQKEQRQAYQDRDRHTSQASPIPFNVIMTPRDKLNIKKQNEENRRTDPKNEIKSNQQHAYQVPMHLLNDVEKGHHEDRRWIREQQRLLEQTLKHFNVKAKVVQATQGPSVTRFEVQPALGVKVSRVRNLSDDIKLNMAAKDIRIEAPIPGKHTIGIEVPNQQTQMVGLQDILQSNGFKLDPSPLTIGLGLDVEGRAKVTDIAEMPHGLIAGATGSGKSVCINSIILSLLYKSSYEDVKLLLIDPKMVELTPYNGIPHLIAPVITDIKAATAALKWAVNEMEDRYQKFVTESVRSIEKYNEKMLSENRVQDKMPYLVIIIDELADLMMIAPQDVEEAISRIAQKARACGIHLILATQRPSVDVITGLIKANIPTRIAFSVSSQVDSRTIIDMNGAERLLGKGDMLLIENGTGKALRLQGAFVSDEEIDRVTSYLRQLAPPNYLFEQEHLVEKMEIAEDEDEILPDVIEFVVEQSQVSTSLLQRYFRIGYNRAARLIDTLEDKEIISGQNGSKPRDVLVSKDQLTDIVSS